MFNISQNNEVNIYSSVDVAVFKDKGPEIHAVLEDTNKAIPLSTVQDMLDSSMTSSQASPNKSKNISDIVSISWCNERDNDHCLIAHGHTR